MITSKHELSEYLERDRLALHQTLRRPDCLGTMSGSFRFALEGPNGIGILVNILEIPLTL